MAANTGSALEPAEHVVLKVMELTFLFKAQFARAIKWHMHVFHDGPRMRTHDEDPIGQINRLFHVMRYKENCTRGFIPYLQQKLLHVTAGLSVKGAERLVHQDDRGAQ